MSTYAPTPALLNMSIPYNNSTNPTDVAQNNSKRAWNWLDVTNQNLQNRLATQTGREDTGYGNVENIAGNKAANPGYTAQEASDIKNQAGLDAASTTPDQYASNYLTPEDLARITGDPTAAMKYYNPQGLTDTQQQTAAGLKQTVGAARTNLGNIQSQQRQDLGAAIDPTQLAQSAKFANTQTGTLADASKAINSAIDPTALGLSSDFTSKYPMSDQEVQDLATSAGAQVGSTYQADKDQLQRAAAASGNASPLAVAAGLERMETQSAGQQSAALTAARLQALAAQRQTEQTQEQMRLGAAQNLTNTQVGATQNQEAQTLAAQQALEQERLGAQQDISTRQMTAAEQEAQLGAGNEQYLTGADLGQGEYAGSQAQQVGQFNQTTGMAQQNLQDQEASQRAQLEATNRQGINLSNQGNQYQQALTKNQLESGRAGTVADKRISDTDTALNTYLAQEQLNNNSANQTQNAVNQAGQIGLGAANTSAQQNLQKYAIDKGQPSLLSKILGAITGAAGAASAVKSAVSSNTPAPSSSAPPFSMPTQTPTYPGTPPTFSTDPSMGIGGGPNPNITTPDYSGMPGAPPDYSVDYNVDYNVPPEGGENGGAVPGSDEYGDQYSNTPPPGQDLVNGQPPEPTDSGPDPWEEEANREGQPQQFQASQYAASPEAQQPAQQPQSYQFQAAPAQQQPGAPSSSQGTSQLTQYIPPAPAQQQAAPAPAAQTWDSYTGTWRPAPAAASAQAGTGSTAPQTQAQQATITNQNSQNLQAAQPGQQAQQWQRWQQFQQGGGGAQGAQQPQRQGQQQPRWGQTQNGSGGAGAGSFGQPPPRAPRIAQPSGNTQNNGGASVSMGNSKPSIPAFAGGGIVTKPTIALLGEAGAEMVVPLTRHPYMRGGGLHAALGLKPPKFPLNRHAGWRKGVPAISSPLSEIGRMRPTA